MPRRFLAVALSDDPAALAEAAAEAVPPELEAALAEIAATLEADGVVLESPEDLERALEARPELRDRLLAAAAADDPPDESEIPALVRTLQDFIAAETWANSYHYLTAHPELLSEAASTVPLAQLIRGATTAGDENAIRVLVEHRDLLRRSREAGAPAAFAAKVDATPEEFEQMAAARSKWSAIAAGAGSRAGRDRRRAGSGRRGPRIARGPGAGAGRAAYLRDRLLAAAGGGEDGDATGGNGQDPFLALLQPWIQTPSWTESYRFLLAHPELLSEEAEAALAGLLERATAAGNANAIGAFSEHLALLRRSREAGAGAAYAEKLGVTPERFEQAVEATAAEAQLPPGARQAFEEVLAALAAEGVSVNSPEELQAALGRATGAAAEAGCGAWGGDDAGPDIPTKFREDIRQADTAEQRYQATGDRAALDEAAAAWERVLGHPEFRAADERFQLTCLNDAGGVFLRRYWAGGRLADQPGAGPVAGRRAAHPD